MGRCVDIRTLSVIVTEIQRLFLIKILAAVLTGLSLSLSAQALPDLTIVPEDTSFRFGSSITCGDINGDNIQDIVIGVPRYGKNGEPGGGNVYVLYGSDSLPDTIDFVDYAGALAQMTANPGTDFGYSLHCRDLNKDNYDDLIVGAPLSGVGDHFERGIITIFYGTQIPWQSSRNLMDSPADVVIYGRSEGDQFGSSLTSGDYNGDGRCDLGAGAVGLHHFSDGRLLSGGAFLILQGNDGLPDTLDLSTEPAGVIEIRGEYENDRFGWAMDSGDVDNDGKTDCLVGAYKHNNTVRDEGACYLLPGTDNANPVISAILFDGVRLFYGSDFPEHMGYSVLIHDLNDDGFMDLFMGSQQSRNDQVSLAGRIRILWGSEIPFENADFTRDTPGMVIEGAVPYGQMSVAMACADITGDGKTDLITGAPLPLAQGAENSGTVYIWHGRDTWPETIDLAQESADQTLSGYADGDWFGSALATGDVNGDGFPDLVVGAPLAGGTGRVYVYYGGDETVSVTQNETLPDGYDLGSNYPNPFNGETVIPYRLPESHDSGVARMVITDINGRFVRSWELTAKGSEVRWNGEDFSGISVPSGLYICRLITGSTKKMIKLTYLK